MSEDGKKKDLLRDSAGIQVTPLLKQGNTVACLLDNLSGGSSHVKAGVIALKKGRSYELTFKLVAGNPSGLKFEANGMDAIWWDSASCPTHEMHNGSMLSHPNVSEDQSTLTVEVDPPATSGLAFYSLNFDGGSRFDPIIIHD